MMTGGIFQLIIHDAAADMRMMGKKARFIYYIIKKYPSSDWDIINLLISRYRMKDILFEHYQMANNISRRTNRKINNYPTAQIIDTIINQRVNYKTLYSTS